MKAQGERAASSREAALAADTCLQAGSLPEVDLHRKPTARAPLSGYGVLDMAAAS